MISALGGHRAGRIAGVSPDDTQGSRVLIATVSGDACRTSLSAWPQQVDHPQAPNLPSSSADDDRAIADLRNSAGVAVVDDIH
ncbi:hypothetical protein, partial [Microbacterium sp. MMO-70]|uniref:hypothetical protein n=1 Tax=Microbacterium sp. MMO-70 TaxID=3081283 RepID=UPI00301AC825